MTSTQPAAWRISADGAEIPPLARSIVSGLDGSSMTDARARPVLGVAGEPGAGKSSFAAALRGAFGMATEVVPMDGFHLADTQLSRLRLLDRKGAPETFDAWGYAALLGRVRQRPAYPVYAPGFARDLEQPLAGAVAVGPDVELVLTEGNYLLLDRPEWQAVRAQLNRVLYVFTDPDLRVSRLVARHVRFGKTRSAAEEWVRRVDEPNARLVAACRARADLGVDLTDWEAPAG